MALQGTLGDFGIADIFQLIGQQQKTGVLHLKSKDDEVRISFKDGNVVRAESSTRKRKELLGYMLARSGLITTAQLESALEEQRRTLKRLGDILVSSGVLQRAALKEMTHLQTTETVYPLFSWKQGDYAFEQQEVDLDAETVIPLRSESVLMEGFRRVDEWPAVRKVITSPRMTFAKLKEVPIAAEADEDEFNLDAAFGDQPAASKDGLGRNERKVFALLAPSRTVQELIDLARIGEFETCKALANLTNGGYLKTIAPVGKDEVEKLGGLTEKTFVGRVRNFFGNVAVTLMLVAALVFLVGQARGLAAGTGGTRFVDPAAQRLVSRGQMERIRDALEVYRLEHGQLPAELEELASEKLLEPAELQFPWSQRYYYRRAAGQDFVLLPPLR
jgi:hypothetical protein